MDKKLSKKLAAVQIACAWSHHIEGTFGSGPYEYETLDRILFAIFSRHPEMFKQAPPRSNPLEYHELLSVINESISMNAERELVLTLDCHGKSSDQKESHQITIINHDVFNKYYWQNFKSCKTWFEWVQGISPFLKETIQLAFKHGVVASDQSLMTNSTAPIEQKHWCYEPEVFGLALLHGHVYGEYASNLADILKDHIVYQCSDSTSGYVSKRALKLIESFNILLDHPSLLSKETLVAVAPYVMSSLASLKSTTAAGEIGNIAYGHELSRKCADVIGRLKNEYGCDISCSNSVVVVAPVIMAIATKNIDIACRLIEMGCETDIRELRKQCGGTHQTENAESINLMGRLFGGDQFSAQITEALMRRRLTETLGPVSSVKVSPPSPNEPSQKPPLRHRLSL